MSLTVAVPAALASALLYGTATAVQHQAVHTGTGAGDARALFALLRDPRWLLSILGDSLGLAFQLLALATGPVVLVQPLLVLAVPVALPVGWALGGTRPSRGDWWACVAIVAGLGVFFAVVGLPVPQQGLSAAAAGVAAATALLVVGGVLLAVRGRGVRVRAGAYGAAAGSMFGLVGVLLDGASSLAQREGVLALVGSASGRTLTVAAVLVGGSALVLTQVAFQVGSLSASFPASEAAAPLVAVILGALLLQEQVPVSGWALALYAGCLLAIVAGTVRLAARLGEPVR